MSGPQFPESLLFPSSLTKNTSNHPEIIQHANRILHAAMKPVEIPQNRQANWSALSLERSNIRGNAPSPFDDQTRALLDAAALVASATNTHLLYKAVAKHGAEMLDNRPNKLDNDDRRTTVHLYLVDPLDDGQLISETNPQTFTIGEGVVGHVAKTKRVLNMAIGDMPDHPTNHLNPRKADDAFNPDEFWMSYEGDPTKEVLCVPIFNEATLESSNDVVGVLHAQRPSIRAHFRKLKSREGGRRGRSRSPAKKSRTFEDQNEMDAKHRLQRQQELSAKNRARQAPYQLISEEALIQLGRLVAAAVLQANADDGENFARQARKFRNQKNMKRVLKVLERGTREAKQRKVQSIKDKLFKSNERNQELQQQLTDEQNKSNLLNEKMTLMEREKEDAAIHTKKVVRELDLLKAQSRLNAITTSQMQAKMLSLERRNDLHKEEFKHHRSSKDIDEINRLMKIIGGMRDTQADRDRKEQERKKKRIMMRIVMRTAAMAFSSWATTVKEIVRQKKQMRRMIMRVMNRALALRFDAWIEYVDERKRMKEMMNKAARRMKNRQIAGSFNSWLEYVDLRLWMKSFCSKMISRFEKKELAMGLVKWISVYNDARRAEFDMDENAKKSRFCVVQ
jgi:hypothetical protein